MGARVWEGKWWEGDGFGELYGYVEGGCVMLDRRNLEIR